MLIRKVHTKISKSHAVGYACELMPSVALAALLSMTSCPLQYPPARLLEIFVCTFLISMQFFDVFFYNTENIYEDRCLWISVV